MYCNYDYDLMRIQMCKKTYITVKVNQCRVTYRLAKNQF